jgi:cobalamin biosynthetic protein CobC
MPYGVFARLPEPAALEGLTATAARAYGVSGPDQVAAAPGTQILLPSVFALMSAGRAAVLGPTYAEHARVARLVGHRTMEVTEFGGLWDADLAVVVNPNNPDGRITSKDALLALADEKRRRGGLLVVDEAFGDVGPAGLSLGPEVGRGHIVVLRSFGKFYGLAGLRLGFALAAPELARRLRAMLGPWAVSGPAIAVGQVALSDTAWAEAMRDTLAREAARLDRMLAGAKLEIVGGTSLFRLVRTPAAADALFDHLGRAGILVRRFVEAPKWLRFGLPGIEADGHRLAAELASFAESPVRGLASSLRWTTWPGTGKHSVPLRLRWIPDIVLDRSTRPPDGASRASRPREAHIRNQHAAARRDFLSLRHLDSSH